MKTDKNDLKANILKVSRELLFKDGFDNFSMRKIAAKVGCKAASIYYHFKNKDEIIYQIILHGRRDLGDSINKATESLRSPKKKYLAAMNAYVEFALANRELYRIMFMTSFPEESVMLVRENISDRIEPNINDLAGYLSEITGKPHKETVNIAHAFWLSIHGYLSIVLLERVDLVFNEKLVFKNIIDILNKHIDFLSK